MAGSPQSTPAPPLWIEESGFRETFLQNIDDPAKRETVRRAGGVFYLALLEATCDNGTTPEDPSATRARRAARHRRRPAVSPGLRGHGGEVGGRLLPRRDGRGRRPVCRPVGRDARRIRRLNRGAPATRTGWLL
jgi:hypothetical protein